VFHGEHNRGQKSGAEQKCSTGNIRELRGQKSVIRKIYLSASDFYFAFSQLSRRPPFILDRYAMV